MKRLISLCMVFLVLCLGLVYKSSNKTKAVVIYTSTEDYNMELLQKRLDEAFPDYEIVVEYMSTSNIATKVIEEGSKCECDIVFHQDYSYLDLMIEAGVLANFNDKYDLSIYTDDAITDLNKNYVLPGIRNGGAIIINKKVLSDRGLSKPKSYKDLLKPEYKGLLSMPSPKSSSTGYMFYLALVNAWGEQKALEYFDGFAENVLAFTTSGSGPVNALKNHEAAVGFGMISQAVEEINSGNDELEVLFFDEGSPYALLGTSVVKGKETRSDVMAVMDYIYSTYHIESCETFYPEQIYKDKQFEKANFPKDIVYSNMNNNTIKQKEKLLKKWKY